MRDSRLFLGIFVVGLALSWAASASADEKIFQNDGWVDNTAAGFQGGFVAGEIGAAVFVPEAADYPVSLRKVRLLFGGGDAGSMRTMKIKVWQDAGGPSPGALLYDEEIQIQSANDAFTEIDLSAAGLSIASGNFRVGVEFNHMGFPGIARDDDPGSDFPDRNYIFAEGIGWVQSSLLGVNGDWVIRVIADVPGQGGNNGNNDPECTVSSDCADDEVCDAEVCVPAGCESDRDCLDNEICSLRTGECVEVDCRDSSDCADGEECNSVFECAAVDEPVNNDTTNNEVTNNDSIDDLTITSITPSEGLVNTAINVTILGSGFTPMTTFRVGPTPLGSVIVNSDFAVTAVVPAGISQGIYNVVANRGEDGAQFSYDQGFAVGVGRPPDDDGCQVGRGEGSVNPAMLVLALGALALLGLRRR